MYLWECRQIRYMFELHGLHLDLVASSYTLHYFGWVSIRLQVHTLTRRPPVAPTNCPIHSSAGDGRRPWLVISALLRNFPTDSACWQPASHSFNWARQHKRRRNPGAELRTHGRTFYWPFVMHIQWEGGAKLGRWQPTRHSISDLFSDWLSTLLTTPLLASCGVEMIPWESLSVHTDELQSHLTHAADTLCKIIEKWREITILAPLTASSMRISKWRRRVLTKMRKLAVIYLFWVVLLFFFGWWNVELAANWGRK